MLPFILTVSDTDDRAFLEELFNVHSSRMYRAAMKILENKQDAEDAVQDTFIKIYGNIDKFRVISGDELILLIIIYTRNTARDILRRRNTALRHTVSDNLSEDKEAAVYDIPDNSSDPLEIVISRESIRETAKMIDELPEAQRDVIILRYRFEMSEREISAALGISETAVSSRILRAKEKLRIMLGKRT